MNKLITERTHHIKGDILEDYTTYTMSLKYRVKIDSLVSYPIDGELISGAVDRFEQDGLYSILGNVSEMCQGNIIVGGNWDCFPSEILTEKNYTLPDPRVGFRVVMESRPKLLNPK